MTEKMTERPATMQRANIGARERRTALANGGLEEEQEVGGFQESLKAREPKSHIR